MRKTCPALLATLILWTTVAMAEDLPTFRDFATMPEAALVGKEMTEAAASGDPFGQIMVTVGLGHQGKEALAMDLLESMWREVGYAPDQVGPDARPLRGLDGRKLLVDVPALLSYYHDLAQHRLAADADPSSLERGLRILLANSEHGHALSASALGLAVSGHPRLPASPTLADRWFELADEGRRFAIDDLGAQPFEDHEPAVPPSADQFGACPSPLDRLDRVLDEAKATQAVIRDAPETADAELAAMKARIEAISGEGRAPPLSMFFNDISPVAVAALSLDMLPQSDEPLAFVDAPWLEDTRIALAWRDMPLPLLLAQLDRELGGAGFRCAGQWVRWVAGARREPTERFLLVPLPLLSGEPDAGGMQTLRWPGPVAYEGELADGRPAGRGVLRWPGAWEPLQGQVHSGQFRRGLLHGAGEIRDADGELLARGEFRLGQLNGPGRRTLLYPHRTVLEGSFEDDVLVSGSGSQGLAAADATAPLLTYVGPFERNQAHGLGECRGEGFAYPCRFHRGVFVGIGELVLVPGATPPR